MAEQTLRLVLTRDELWVFLGLVGATTMNGLPADPTVGLSALELAERLNIGEQSLINRGLLIVDESGMQLDDGLMALVGGAVVPAATLQLTRFTPGQASFEQFFHATPELLIEQHSPKPGVFMFDYFASVEALTLRLQAILAPLYMGGDSGGSQEFFIDAPSFVENVKAARQLGSSPVPALQTAAASVDQARAIELAQAFANRPSWWAMAGWGLRQEGELGAKIAVAVMDTHGAWLVEQGESDPNQLAIRQVSGQTCEQALIALLEPLAHVYHPSA